MKLENYNIWKLLIYPSYDDITLNFLFQRMRVEVLMEDEIGLQTDRILSWILWIPCML